MLHPFLCCPAGSISVMNIWGRVCGQGCILLPPLLSHIIYSAITNFCARLSPLYRQVPTHTSPLLHKTFFFMWVCVGKGKQYFRNLTLELPFVLISFESCHKKTNKQKNKKQVSPSAVIQKVKGSLIIFTLALCFSCHKCRWFSQLLFWHHPSRLPASCWLLATCGYRLTNKELC